MAYGQQKVRGAHRQLVTVNGTGRLGPPDGAEPDPVEKLRETDGTSLGPWRHAPKPRAAPSRGCCGLSLRPDRYDTWEG
jgi:hypothetical protein